MKYLIDSANLDEIQKCLRYGFKGITANPSMYLKENVNFYEFIETCTNLNPEILTAEVIGNNLYELLESCDNISNINKNIIIKINFSEIGLELINILNRKGVKTACTLIFNTNQASLAVNAGADYLFPFIGRNDENGYDGIKNLTEICDLISINGYNTKVVAASIKNVFHLTQASICGCDYAAVTYDLFKKASFNQLTVDGTKTFEKDWSKVNK
ncbi:aldolase [Clostridioides sp. ES-S-0108-01]|uniref:transaldolase family protein n=1 Tax=Clostridioides sp. ES-S-0108-01 TaxID=2770773 RepID=UPI001D0C89A3|nr:aldolase [Clostridioides sp. ES-S-0108-01]UDN50695.1 aldolase [Clostridioides sp. ES-S-0107-01]